MVEELILVAGGILGMLLLGFVAQATLFKSYMKRETRQTQIEQVLRAIGFKNMKVSDLNAKNLDETGFIRLFQLLRELRAPSAANNPFAALQNAIQQGQQIAQAAQGMIIPAASPGITGEPKA